MAFLHGREYTLEEERENHESRDDSQHGYLPSSPASTFIQHIQELPAVLEIKDSSWYTSEADKGVTPGSPTHCLKL